MAVLAAPPGGHQRQGHARGQSRRMVVSQPVAAAADGRRGSAKRTGDPGKHQEASMIKEVPEHIQRHRVGRASAALPGWAAVKFTDAQAAAMRPVGIEMLNKRGVCALHLKIIADAAGVGVGAAREVLNIADTIGLITIERHLRGLYNMRSRSPEWLAGLRELQERTEHFERETVVKKAARR